MIQSYFIISYWRSRHSTTSRMNERITNGWISASRIQALWAGRTGQRSANGPGSLTVRGPCWQQNHHWLNSGPTSYGMGPPRNVGSTCRGSHDLLGFCEVWLWVLSAAGNNFWSCLSLVRGYWLLTHCCACAIKFCMVWRTSLFFLSHLWSLSSYI